MITTEAWVLRRGADGAGSALEGDDFRRATISLSALADDELLVEPLFGCWEGNMSHALARRPIDVCRQRGEEQVVLGNSGVVRVLAAGAAVRGIREGEVGALLGTGEFDEFGYMVRAFAYDAPGTIGVLARRTKILARCFVPLPVDSAFSLAQWAAHSLRYATAWSNWKVAIGAYRLQVDEVEDPAPHVWGWSGGTTFAELDLARRQGCRVAMISGSDAHLAEIRAAGIEAVDRRGFRTSRSTSGASPRTPTTADFIWPPRPRCSPRCTPGPPGAGRRSSSSTSARRSCGRRSRPSRARGC